MVGFAGCGFGATKEMLKRIFIGQAVAFLNSLTGVSTTELANNNASYSVLQCLTSYLFILAFYGPGLLFLLYRFRHRQFSDFKFFDMWWKYAILAFVDLEANYVVVLAYQYTNMMSAQLLGCFTVPCVLVLSFFILKMKFALTHIAGGVIAIGGLVFLIALDADGLSRNESGGSKEVLGDILCLISSALYATSNVLTELFVKPSKQANLFARCRKPEPESAANDETPVLQQQRGDEPVQQINQEGELDAVGDLPKVPMYVPVVENLAMMSLFASVFATIQFFAAEWKTFKANRGAWTNQDWLFQMVFGISMLLLYTLMPLLFIVSSAAFANISLLTANIYGIIWNVTIFRIYPTKLFFLSYIIIVVGILLYNLTDVIRIPFCARWNYPCGDPFKDEGDGADVDGDEQLQDSAAPHPQRQLSILREGDGDIEKRNDTDKLRRDATGQVDAFLREY
jgi:solute carrier family 35, member F1/2